MSSSLTSIAQQITVYIGFPLLISGILGTCLNIIVFSSLRTFQKSSCAFYLTILSFADLMELCVGLISRLFITGLNIDRTKDSIILCKLRPVFLYLAALLSSYCLSLATIDQYLATSTRIRWQQWCNTKNAHRCVLICVIILVLEQIPSLFFYQHVTSSTTNQTTCQLNNHDFFLFDRYFTVFTLWYACPLITTILFASLAYRNVQSIAHRVNPLVRRELDKQLTVMVLIHALIYSITIMPNIISSIILVNDALKLNPVLYSQMVFFNTISIMSFYFSFSVS